MGETAEAVRFEGVARVVGLGVVVDESAGEAERAGVGEVAEGREGDWIARDDAWA